MKRVDIEVGLPIPEKVSKYPWNDLQIGQSFVYKGKRTSANAIAWKVGNEKGWKFTLRSVDGGIRIWRTA